MSAGHIRRRGAQSWELKYDVGADPLTGRRRIRYASFKGNRRDAALELARLVAEHASGAGVDPSKTSVAEFLRRWLDWASAHVSRKTHERYCEIVRLYVTPHIGGLSIQKLRPVHLVDLYAKLQERGGSQGGALSPRSVGHVHRILRRAFALAMTWGVTTTNVATAVKPPPVAHSEIPILTPEQIGRVLRALEGQDLRPIVSFLLATGCRRGEALALRWKDVELDKGMVRIERSLEQTRSGVRVQSPKTAHSRRSIAIPPWLVAELRAHRARQLEQRLALGLGKAPDDGLVFARWDGSPHVPLWATQKFTRTMTALGIVGVTLHALRHTHASSLIASGIDVLTISRRLGHATPSITLGVYGHLFSNTDARAAEVTEALFAKIRD
jgi:integrase